MNREELRRSRSRTRESKDYRICDETIATSRNIKTSELIPRGHRSLSRVNLLKRDSDQFFQTALVNHNLRHTSPAPEYQNPLTRTNSLRSLNDGQRKNIPMKDESRPLIKRWNSIQYLSNDEVKKDDKFMPPSSISPLTVIKDQYDTKRPVSNYAAPSPDNYFKDLEGVGKHQTSKRNLDEEISDDIKMPTANTTPMESLTNKIYNKMSKLLGGEQNPNKHNYKYKVDSSRTSLLKYQSELDDEEEGVDEDEDKTLPNNYDLGVNESWDSPIVEGSSDINELNIDSIMDEINDFQNNFVQKFNATTPQSEFEPEPSSRIQRKILDYKDLYQDESISKNSSYFSLKLQNLNNIFNDYNFKIQYEKISQEYNVIRLRFPNIPNFENYVINGERTINTKTKKHVLKSNVGALGFLNRVKALDDTNLDPSNAILKKPLRKSSVLNVEEYLMNIWNEEMETLLIPSSTAPSSSSTSQTQLPLTFGKPSSSYHPLNPPLNQVNQSLNGSLSNKSSFDVTPSDFAALASKVKLGN